MNNLQAAKLHTLRQAKTRGQTMIILSILLGLGVLIGLIAIAFDGGSALLQRRTMQNGAEAGSLSGINMMGQNLLVTCNPAPCHPSFAITNAAVYADVGRLASANRGGTTGAVDSNYRVDVEYHYMSGAPVYSDTYQPAANDSNFVPEFVDGLRVTTVISNPTTFARAIRNPITTLGVSARAAARLYPTCAEVIAGGSTLPFTRFRPSLEREMADPGRGNGLCNPFQFWSPSPDVGGAQNSNFKNTMSLNTNSFHPETGVITQLISGVDTRHGAEGSDGQGSWPDSGLSNFSQATGWDYRAICYDASGNNCADMRATTSTGGNQATQDISNWIFWQWRGVISTTTSFINPLYSTFYPATPATLWGRCCGASNSRPGDWAETEYRGSTGQNIQEAVYAMARDQGEQTPLSPPPPAGLGWGKAITRTIVLWGDNEADLALYPGRSAQTLVRVAVPCPPPNDNQTCSYDFHWQDTNITGTYPGYTADADLNRVRFTKAYNFVFYENLQGSHGAIAPAYCPSGLPSSGSSAWGIFTTQYVPGPEGTDCPQGWITGGGVYSRQLPP